MRHDEEGYMITIGKEGITLWRVGQAGALARKKRERLRDLEKEERKLETAMTKNRLEQEEINRWLNEASKQTARPTPGQLLAILMATTTVSPQCGFRTRPGHLYPHHSGFRRQFIHHSPYGLHSRLMPGHANGDRGHRQLHGLPK